MLTGYDGRTFTYDSIGNLTSDGERTYTWKHGRQLAMLSDGATTWAYTYNTDGMRISKTNGTDTYTYVYNGGNLSQVTVGNNVLRILYDAEERPMAVLYNNALYFYATNLQGDVIAILNTNRSAVVEYTYDAWGNILSCTGTMANTLGALNPLRYRSYVYDQETGLYYLQSRYYNPEIGRFISSDIYTATGQGLLGNNMFAYCLNNPANQTDSLGTASYQNSYTVNTDNKGNILGYNVVTTISILWTKLTYKYYIKANGVVQFDFDKNNYWSLLWRGCNKTLAEAIYKQAKAINKNFLYGRTIGGLNTELQGHWAAYVVTGSGRAGVADMGALIRGKPGYDSNAWFWEGGNAAKIVSKINFSRRMGHTVWGYSSIMRDLLRYI